MRVLVTGAAGFIGSHTVDRFIRRGDEVVAVDDFNDYYDPQRKRANLSHLLGHPRFALVEGLVGKKAVLSMRAAPSSEPPVTFADIGKARRLLDYDPKTPVAEGMAHLWEWYRAEILSGENA